MNNTTKILIGVLMGLFIVGAAVMFVSASAINDVSDGNSFMGQVQNTVNHVKNVASNDIKSGSNIIGGGSEFNSQEGNGYFYQINYTDGNFRQYDTKTGKLIGSSFNEDQSILGNADGFNLE